MTDISAPITIEAVSISASITVEPVTVTAPLGIGQTGLDRIATGEDRVQTGLDRIATGEDVAAAALSALAARETLVELGNVAGTQAMDLSQGTIFNAAATAACVWSFINPQPGFTSVTLILFNGCWLGQTFPTVHWPSGVTPTLTEGGYDVLDFMSPDNWITVFGFLSGRNIQ